jgi:hypothetical protein
LRSVSNWSRSGSSGADLECPGFQSSLARRLKASDMALFAAPSHLATAKSLAIYAGGCRFRADLQRFCPMIRFDMDSELN